MRQWECESRRPAAAAGRSRHRPLTSCRVWSCCAAEAAARHLSFTKAADELALTQSAVSRQIQQMEEGLGVALFERRHRAGADAGRAHDEPCRHRLPGAPARRHRQRAGPACRRDASRSTTPGFALAVADPRAWRLHAIRRSTCACPRRTARWTWCAARSTSRCASPDRLGRASRSSRRR
ncbi:MAG: LysR family transcriptional regulator [Rhodoferax sp.]